MMMPVFIVAVNTFREIMRDRILYGLIVFVLLFFGISTAMGELTYTERVRISINFGLAAMQLSAVILSIFIGATLVAKEIDKKTVMTLLARPITRFQFLIGKSLGLVGVIAAILAALAVVLVGTFYWIGYSPSWSLLVVLHGMVLEAIVLLGFAIFFSTFATSASVASFCIGLFLIGHWLGSLEYFMGKSKNALFIAVGFVTQHVVPDLEKFNWRPLLVYKEDIAFMQVLEASVYSICYFTVLVLCAAYIFKRKDFN